MPKVSSEDDESINGGGPSSSECAAIKAGIPELELEPSEGVPDFSLGKSLVSSMVAIRSTNCWRDFLVQRGAITVMFGGRCLSSAIGSYSAGSSAMVADSNIGTCS